MNFLNAALYSNVYAIANMEMNDETMTKCKRNPIDSVW